RKNNKPFELCLVISTDMSLPAQRSGLLPSEWLQAGCECGLEGFAHWQMIRTGAIGTMPETPGFIRHRPGSSVSNA
ncbi:MAG: hypothetical protein ACRCTO_11200, partial [Pseudomonas paracarnis]